MMAESQLRCPSCQAEARPPGKFCGECGALLPLPCPGCGHRNPATNKFCGECGAKLVPPVPTAAEESAASRSRLATPFRDTAPVAYTPKHLAEKILRTRDAFEGERKQVTVLFTDVSGFTAMSERLDPEEVHAIMNRAFEVILDAVHLFEGTVNQFLGDGVMALFGAPIAHEDHAHRALRAALAMQDRISPLRHEILRKHGVDFRIRMGLNTGRVVVGAIGRDLRMDYTAVGDTTNLAARLLGVAQPGQIVVSKGTRRPTDGYFTFEDLGEFSLKGKSEPVRAYAVISEIRGRTRLEVSRERGLTPLVGRERELTRLVDIFGHAQTGEGAVVLLVGEPGIGKSRVLYEFLRRIEGSGPLELETTCVSHGRAMPFHPILAVIRRYLNLPDDLPDADVRQRIGERLETLGLGGEEPVALLAHFIGIPTPDEVVTRLGGAQLKERTLALVRAVLLGASVEKPTVLVVENLHWADASSADFVHSLAGDIPGHRFLLVLSTRPGATEPTLGETITLERLGTVEVHAMIRKVLDTSQVSAPLVATLLERCEGNPLYVEEMLRQLRETGGVVVEDGEARLAAAGALLPGSIHDLIAARIDRLEDSVKHTLQVAAVVGREFSIPVLSRAVEDPATLAQHLTELTRLEFVFPKMQLPEPIYSFKHALTQEVAYGSLLERRRRLYHEHVGMILEETQAGRLDDAVELLAYHYGRSGLDEKAVDYAILAAEKAQRRWANTEALAQFEGAGKRLDSMADTLPNRLRRIDSVVKQAEVKFALGRHAEHVQALEAIRDVVESSADPPRRAAWYCWTGFLHSLTGGRPEVPLAYCGEASAIADAHGLAEIGAIADCCLTHVSVVAGQLRQALAAGERALGAFEARNNIWWTCRTLWGLSMAANASGEWERSLEYCRRGLELGRIANDLRLKVVGWWRTGSTYVQQGIPHAGLRCCDEALALSPVAFDAAMVKAIRGYALVKSGKVSAGTLILTEVVTWLDQSKLQYTRSVIGLLLAEAYLYQSDHGRARELAHGILTISRDSGYRHLEGVAERLFGEALVGVDDVAAAEHLSRAEQLAGDTGAANEGAKSLMGRAELHRRRQDHAKARELAKRAYGIFETLGTVDELTRAKKLLSELDAPFHDQP
jgi:class 3 adenylate cyclase/tetratricopeptide (TPR) repeat protein